MVPLYDFILPAMFCLIDAVWSYYGIIGANGLLFFFSRTIFFPITFTLSKYLFSKQYSAYQIIALVIAFTGALCGTMSEVSRIFNKDHIDNTFFNHGSGTTIALLTAFFTTVAGSMQSICEEKLIMKDQQLHRENRQMIENEILDNNLPFG
jgi:uncharacterized membrane protein